MLHCIRLGKGLAIVTVLYFAGEFIHSRLQLTLPGGVIGMLLLFALINLRIIDIRQIEDAAQLLLRHMSLFFIPVSVGTLVYFDLIKSYLVAIAATTVLSLLAVLWATGFTVEAVSKRNGGRGHE